MFVSVASVINTARADEPQVDATAHSNNPVLSMLPLVVIFVVFYFLMIRPQQKKSREFAAMLDALNIGDKIATSGGIIGYIVGIDKDRSTVELKINNTSSIMIYRKAITEVLEADKSTAVRKKKA